MADEQQESQQEAEKNNELPEGVLVESVPVDDYTKENEQVKDKLAEFGETDLEQFLAKVTSDALFGKMVIRKMLGLDADKPFINIKNHTAPQENNIVGVLDHATYPPTVQGKTEVSKDDAPEPDAATV
jgi:hypothetical protein